MAPERFEGLDAERSYVSTVAGWVARAFVLTLVVGSGSLACQSGCDEDTVNGAVAFLKAHQGCVTNDDCVVVSDICGVIPGGSCGQLVQNRTGAESQEWKAFERELGECAADSCDVCGALVIPQCENASCGGP